MLGRLCCLLCCGTSPLGRPLDGLALHGAGVCAPLAPLRVRGAVGTSSIRGIAAPENQAGPPDLRLSRPPPWDPPARHHCRELV